MARAPKATPTAAPTGTALTNWDEELARQAEIAQSVVSHIGGGQWISSKSGVLSFNSMPFPGNQMAVIIADYILENIFYEGAYDPDNAAPPTCYAFGRDKNEMKPHADVVARGDHQHDQCQGCPMNEFATAATGKGKACGNKLRMAMISAGEFDRDGRFKIYEASHFTNSPLAYFKTPVTSGGGFATFVKQVAGALRRPPHGIVTRVSAVPDNKTQFKILFEPLIPVPNDIMGIVMSRHDEAKRAIEFP